MLKQKELARQKMLLDTMYNKIEELKYKTTIIIKITDTYTPGIHFHIILNKSTIIIFQDAQRTGKVCSRDCETTQVTQIIKLSTMLIFLKELLTHIIHYVSVLK